MNRELALELVDILRDESIPKLTLGCFWNDYHKCGCPLTALAEKKSDGKWRGQLAYAANYADMLDEVQLMGAPQYLEKYAGFKVGTAWTEMDDYSPVRRVEVMTMEQRIQLADHLLDIMEDA